MNRVLEDDLKTIIAEDLSWEKLKNKTVMITGASGMVGSYMLYVLLMLNDEKHYGIKVDAVMRNVNKLPEEIRNREDVNVVVADVTKDIPDVGDIDYIIHAASPASPLIMQNQPVETIAANTIGTFKTLELAKEKNAEGYLFISSREIYGQPDEGQEFFYENTYGFVDQLNPRSCYSEGKKAAETMCVCFHEEYGLNTKIARLAHTYGPGMSIYDGRVQADFLKNVYHNENIVLKSEGTAVRTYTYIADAIAGMYRILLDSEDIVYNIGNEAGKVSIRDLAEILVSIYPERGLKLVFDIPEGGTKGTAPYTLGILSSEKLRKLGWNPKYSVKDGFKRTLEYLELENVE
ncbi:NAD-dependent epimerase/dehydratase family protein [Dorea sp. OM07-5]|uniref:NAD-dependent epimerase/dehydratase family protein n=1 Tax=Dorea sp. OM07-5 TaxID=2293100 RepID=UPI000E4D68AD|nr:NAD-dependent epimerase/dehydratase family protein [Dorea sp. OM07-5]RHU97096.1 NAD-dependent epimerase/dehydratase family protein [Dorea sp. OM07-5]